MAKEPKLGTKLVRGCAKCAEPTTHRYDLDPDTKTPTWICICCVSSKFRSKNELTKIRAKKKGRPGVYRFD